jgi:hypothetical protein
MFHFTCYTMMSSKALTMHRLFEQSPEPSPAMYKFVQNLLPFTLSTFSIKDRSLVCRRAVEVVYKASGKKIIPRYDQFECLVQLQYQYIGYVAGQKSREARHQVTRICEGNILLSIVLGGTLFPLPQHPRKLT